MNGHVYGMLNTKNREEIKEETKLAKYNRRKQNNNSTEQCKLKAK